MAVYAIATASEQERKNGWITCQQFRDIVMELVKKQDPKPMYIINEEAIDEAVAILAEMGHVILSA